MKKNAFTLIFLFTWLFIQAADYTVKSTHLLNPELNINFVKQNADFWINAAYDAEYGGFFSDISREGKPQTRKDKSPVPYYRKSFITHSRLAYSFTKAFMLTGDEAYLDYAKLALDFLTKYAWDKDNGGWYTFGLRNGDVDNNGWWNPNTTKWAFQQHYAMLGIIGYYEATRDAFAKEWVDKGMNSLNRMWDTRPGYEGYYATAGSAWENIKDKGFTPTVDGITTNAELLYLISQKPEHKERLMQLADNIVDKMLIHMNNPGVKVMYPEEYDSNWNINWGNKVGSIGHFIKTAWCLTRAYICDTTKTQYKEAAARILDQTWNYNANGVTIWDHVNGAPFNEINISTGAYTNIGKNKDYWTVEQGFTGPMINYYVTKNPLYLRMADESLDFFMKYFIDTQYGETYSTVNASGSQVINFTKGDDFKAGYHSNELGYYAYLYGNLYYLNQPATLYYLFNPKDTPREITLTPIPMLDGELKIKSVTLDGNLFTDYDAANRTLRIAANQGGKFKVTFDTHTITGVNDTWAENIRVYPTITRGAVHLSNLENVTGIRVSDLTGKTLVSLQDIRVNETSIDLSGYNSGVYLITITTKVGGKITKKVVKQD